VTEARSAECPAATIKATAPKLVDCSHVVYGLRVTTSTSAWGSVVGKITHKVSRLGLDASPMIDSHSCSDILYTRPHHHIIEQRFSEVHALHQALLRCPTAKAAAKSLAHVAPKKTMTWSALLKSDTRDATIAKRMVEVPKYLNAVLADQEVRIGGGWICVVHTVLYEDQSLLHFDTTQQLAAHPAVQGFFGVQAPSF
jgi:hypothetical protein